MVEIVLCRAGMSPPPFSPNIQQRESEMKKDSGSVVRRRLGKLSLPQKFPEAAKPSSDSLQVSRPWKPSEQQEAIFSAVANGNDNIVVQAGAGCGKTTTTIEALKGLPRNTRTILLAFNKSIAEELQEKVPAGVEAKTLHSLGYSAVRDNVPKVRVDRDKVENAIKRIYPKEKFPVPPGTDRRTASSLYYSWLSSLRKLVSLVKNYGLDSVNNEQVSDIVYNYGIIIRPTELLVDQVNTLLSVSRREVQTIDFDDMLWLPMVEGWKIPRYDFVGIDESQDLNPLRQQYVLRAGERIMVIGDSHQSIYGFCGADVQSMDTMTRLLEAQGATISLPLNITRRCPKTHVALANEIHSGALQAAPEAPEGTVGKSRLEDAMNSLTARDFVLCRTNAPLVWAALQMVRQRRPVVILGRDFGEGLKHIVRSCEADTYKEYFTKLSAWYYEQLSKFDGSDTRLERAREAITDKYQSIKTLSEQCCTSEELLGVIDSLFGESARKEAVVMSTVHKAKGLEANRVFIICPHLIPHSMAKRDWEKQQEWNLKYVAVTRSKQHLEFVEGDPFRKDN